MLAHIHEHSAVALAGDRSEIEHHPWAAAAAIGSSGAVVGLPHAGAMIRSRASGVVLALRLAPAGIFGSGVRWAGWRLGPPAPARERWQRTRCWWCPRRWLWALAQTRVPMLLSLGPIMTPVVVRKSQGVA